MKKFLQSSSNNWTLIIGVIGLLLSIILLLTTKDPNVSNRGKYIYNLPLSLFIIVALLAPFWEEVVFRGMFSKNKFWKVSGYILFVLVSGIVLYENYGIIFTGSFVLVVAVFFILRKHKAIEKNVTKIKIIVTSLVFGLAHHAVTDFPNLFNIYNLTNTICIGLVLAWICLNYNLIKTILAHLFWNGTIVILSLFPLIFVDEKVYEVHLDNASLSWNEVPYFSTFTGTLDYLEDGIEIKALTLKEITQFLLDEKMFEEYIPEKDPNLKLNLKYKIEGVENYTFDKTSLKELLIEAKIIRPCTR